MRYLNDKRAKRGLSLAMALVLTATLSAPALADGGDIPPVWDEAYYATLDYYGGLMESSVVKSCHTRGSDALTDYGVYDEVVNLTDESAPDIADGQVTFQLGEDTPGTFYFEGKTQKPYQDLPWKISLSYKLNGVPTPAEDLAGEKGVVEILLDAVPNEAAPEYLRNNLVLTAAAMFNDDDILSLEAPGAQVQLVGNLRTVLFAVLPGEEQHFTISVGSEDFAFSGMVFLAVPATLAQLDQVAELKESKDKVQDSYDAIDASLDVILDTLEGMSGSLNATANGLDALNQVRGDISAGKGPVYDSADTALADLDALADAMGPIDAHLDTASQAITDTTAVLGDLTDNAVALKSQLADSRALVEKLQTDTANLQAVAKLLEDYNDGETRKLIKNLSSDADSLNDDMKDLSDSLDKLRVAVETMKPLSGVGDFTIEVGGQQMTPAQIKKLFAEVKTAHDQYLGFLASDQNPGYTQETLPFSAFLTNIGGKTPEEAAQIEYAWGLSQDQDTLDKLEQAGSASDVMKTVDAKITEVNKLIKHVSEPTADLLLELQTLCDTMGDKGFTDDLQRLTKLCADLMEDLEKHDGEAAALLDHLDESGDLLVSVSHNADTALDLIQTLDDTLDAYVPDTQQALTDAKGLSDTAVTGIRDAKVFFSAFETLLRSNGDALDAGTQQTLSGLSAALRKSTQGLDRTGTIRDAKTTISGLIDDEWDAHAGGDNNLLLMDASAAPISLTDQRNGSPQSIQFIMRSQEIKAAEPEAAETAAQTQTALGGVWDRIKAMFADLWHTITGFFQ